MSVCHQVCFYHCFSFQYTMPWCCYIDGAPCFEKCEVLPAVLFQRVTATMYVTAFFFCQCNMRGACLSLKTSQGAAVNAVIMSHSHQMCHYLTSPALSCVGCALQHQGLQGAAGCASVRGFGGTLGGPVQPHEVGHYQVCAQERGWSARP